MHNMKPKERRNRLFKSSRPNIREMSLIDQQGYSSDMNILWGAYKMGSFKIEEGAPQDVFAEYMAEEVQPYAKKWIIEDDNPQFSDGYGPVGMMCATYNGWELEPHFEAFKWASKKNILRSVVSFLQMMRYDRDVGIVNVYSRKNTNNLFRHAERYGVLKYAAKIPNGDIMGDRYIYYVRGRKDGSK